MWNEPDESPRCDVADQGGEKTPDVYTQDPYKVLDDIVDRWIAAEEADRAERGLSGLMPDLQSAQADRFEDRLQVVRRAGNGAQHFRDSCPLRKTRGGAALPPRRMFSLFMRRR
jgi:hypothetical protein